MYLSELIAELSRIQAEHGEFDPQVYLANDYTETASLVFDIHGHCVVDLTNQKVYKATDSEQEARDDPESELVGDKEQVVVLFPVDPIGAK